MSPISCLVESSDDILLPAMWATFASDETCQDRFNTSQLKEVEEPACYAVHHLSVPCYMLQHNAYSREGWLAVRELLYQFIHRGLTPTMVRQQSRVKFDSGHRTWSITKGSNFRALKALNGRIRSPMFGSIQLKHIVQMFAVGRKAS